MTQAAAAQRAASDPAVSAFVSAHAGTGKTKLLVDRLVRLMLAGADPARILCLTYTKAAAAEMAIRLQRQLGRWVTLGDAELDAELAALEVPRGTARRQMARALFAQVLDLPGGMRIGTIHAFCQSLLKRFPLEAAISPHFQLIETADKHADLDQAREAVLPEADEAVLACLAGLVNADMFSRLITTLDSEADRLAPALALAPEALDTALRRAARVTQPDEATMIADAVDWPARAGLRAHLAVMARAGSDTVKLRAEEMIGWIDLPADLRAEHFDQWVKQFFDDRGGPRGFGRFPNPKLATLHPPLLPGLLAEQKRIDAVQDMRRALRLVAATAALLRVASPILRLHAESKNRRALLDYNDLITGTARLLKQPGAAWVLFKLDGGLDHLLLDEVQDTAPAQWHIADQLTGDFYAGAGAEPAHGLARTVFAVGDRKQSIYSFQGADPAEFDRWRDIYASRVRAAGLGWRQTTLDVSFRSTAPVLSLVDAIFAEAAFADGVHDDPAIKLLHVPQRAGQAGEVEFWPLAPLPEAAPVEPWRIADRNQTQSSALQTLVNHLAAWLAGQLDGTVMLASENRPLRPGDVLVLVRRRGQFDRALVRALKGRGVPVAGLDRMVLTDQPAVRDLMALCQALLLPRDDLSLAEMLVSPLGGLSDDSLMRLAMGRAGSLWDILRARAGEQPDWAAADAFFSTLLARADYAAPYDLLSEALGTLGGRARLFARLGPEAAEPVDELLAAALLHGATHPPSLQTFLQWVAQSASEVKREGEAAGDAVRIMTVHGAKGLEAPLVILPDTSGLPPAESGLQWTTDSLTGVPLPLWQPNAELRCTAISQLRAANMAAQLREYRRLLYVALTRARDRLLICGWALRTAEEGCWHDMVAHGLRQLAATPIAFNAWPGEAVRLVSPQQATPEKPRAGARAASAAGLPAWAGQAPHWRPAALPSEPALPRPLAPSRPTGVELGPVPAARSPLAGAAGPGRFARGLAMHALLQHLPDLPQAARADAARAYAAQPGLGLDDADTLADQALAVLTAPEATAIFGPGSRAEQPIAGLVGGQIICGQVDRLCVRPDRVLIADYKTNRAPPDQLDEVPVFYLRQMAAYRAVLARLYPDRAIDCLLIWTEGPLVMTLPADLLDSHAPGAATPSATLDRPHAATILSDRPGDDP